LQRNHVRFLSGQQGARGRAKIKLGRGGRVQVCGLEVHVLQDEIELGSQSTKDAKRLDVEVGRVRVDFFALLITTADESGTVDESSITRLQPVDPLSGDDLRALISREVLHQDAGAEDTTIRHGFELQQLSGAPMLGIGAAHCLCV